MSEYRVTDLDTGDFDTYQDKEDALREARAWAKDISADNQDGRLVVQEVSIKNILILKIIAPDRPQSIIHETWADSP